MKDRGGHLERERAFRSSMQAEPAPCFREL